jgi:hypothetical protein
MTMMALDARSLRAWLTLAQMSFSAHPTAAPAALAFASLREQPSLTDSFLKSKSLSNGKKIS